MSVWISRSLTTSSDPPASLILYRQMHVLQFFDLMDHNRVRSLSLIDIAGHPDVVKPRAKSQQDPRARIGRHAHGLRDRKRSADLPIAPRQGKTAEFLSDILMKLL